MDTSLAAKKSDLLPDLRALIEAARGRVARAVKTGLVGMNWAMGDRIRREILGERRAAYGQRIVATVSRQLVAEYGRGYSLTGLTRMMQLSERFPDREIVASLMQQLTWSHFLQLIPIKDRMKREFYAEMCRVEKWNVETFVERRRDGFPADFMLVFRGCEAVAFERRRGVVKPRRLVRAFTEVGVEALAGLLRSERAVAHSIATIREGVANFDRIFRGRRS